MNIINKNATRLRVSTPIMSATDRFNLRGKALESFQRLLRPLVRLLLRNGISFSEFVNATRDVFIQEAIKDSWRNGRDSSVARVAITTGLTRAEVTRTLDEWADKNKNAERGLIALTARLLTGWSTDPKYAGPYGWPIDVPFVADPDDPFGSFTELVDRYCGDISPRTMLDQLIKVQAITETGSGMLRLENRAYIPEARTHESFDRLSSVASNVIQTIDHNIQVGDDNGRFERTVTSDHGIAARNIPKLSAFLQERGGQFLEELDTWMTAYPPGVDDEPLSVGVGVYLYVENSLDRWDPSEFGLHNPIDDRS